MTTAPTPSLQEVHAIADELERAAAFPAYPAGPYWTAATLLRRLQAENERLRAAERTLQHLGYQDRGGQQWAPPLGQAPDFGLIDSLRDRIAELVGDRLTAQKVEAICAREPYAVTGVVLSHPDGRACIVNQSAVRWFHGERDFWSVMHPDSNPQPISYRCRIGLPCSKCQTGKYRAAGNGYYDFHRCDSCMHVPMWGADGNELGPAPLIASREVVADGPVRVTRLHLSTEGRAALTTKATGPLPGTKET